MKNSLDNIKKQLSKVIHFLNRYSFILFLLIFASMAGFLVLRIGELSRAEPTQAEIDQALAGIKPTKLDQDAIAKLNELQGKDISIEALFNNGRTNPFEN